MHGLDRWMSQSKNRVPIHDPPRYVCDEFFRLYRLWSDSTWFSNPFHSKNVVCVHLAVPYEAKLQNQRMDLAENWFVNSYLEYIGTLWSKSFRFSNSFHLKFGIYAHLAVPYEAKLCSQWEDLAENRCVSSYSNPIDTLWSKSLRVSNSFLSKVGIFAHLAVRYEAKLRSQWAYLAENRRVSSYSNPIDTLWSKSFRFSSSFHSKDGVYVHLGIALMSINQGWSDGVLALPTYPPSHLEAVPSPGNFMSILLSNCTHSEYIWYSDCNALISLFILGFFVHMNWF